MYLRSKCQDGQYRVSLIAAKTKVAPMKKLTLPKLELNAALLLSELIKKVTGALRLPKVDIFAWSDSTVTLDWINGDPNRWKEYVANRVGAIQDIVPPERWRYVPSELNPADCASRG